MQTKLQTKIGMTVEMDTRDINAFIDEIPALRSNIRKSLRHKNLPTGGISFKIDENGLLEIECNNGFANFMDKRRRDIRNVPLSFTDEERIRCFTHYYETSKIERFNAHARCIYDNLYRLDRRVFFVRKSTAFYEQQATDILEILFEMVQNWMNERQQKAYPVDFLSPISYLIASGTHANIQLWNYWENICRFEDDYHDYYYDDGKVVGEEFWFAEQANLHWASLVNYDAQQGWVPGSETIWTYFTGEDWKRWARATDPVLPPLPPLTNTDKDTHIMYEKQDFQHSVKDEYYEPETPKKNISWANCDEDVVPILSDEDEELTPIKQIRTRRSAPPAPKKNPWKRVTKRNRTRTRLSPIHFPSLS